MTNIQTTDGWLNLPSISLPLRALFTGYLLVTGLGLLMAGAQILLTHGMAMENWAFPSMTLFIAIMATEAIAA